jgi:hypothetical protein
MKSVGLILSVFNDFLNHGLLAIASEAQRQRTLLKKQFVVSAINLSLMLVIGFDTLCLIQKSLFILSADVD